MSENPAANQKTFMLMRRERLESRLMSGNELPLLSGSVLTLADPLLGHRLTGIADALHESNPALHQGLTGIGQMEWQQMMGAATPLSFNDMLSRLTGMAIVTIGTDQSTVLSLAALTARETDGLAAAFVHDLPQARVRNLTLKTNTRTDVVADTGAVVVQKTTIGGWNLHTIESKNSVRTLAIATQNNRVLISASIPAVRSVLTSMSPVAGSGAVTTPML